MRIVIASFATVKAVLGARSFDLDVPDHSTVRDVMAILLDRFGKPLADEMYDSPGCLKENYLLMVNGQTVRFLNGMETVMGEGDELLIFSPVCGG
ncbi:thiamine S protein [Pseudodesulfovibrio mercurii]|uniref:Thiamine S protein n=1 Tax=Pseudodesulfovibrio mercurii TaxID=641491 RepID=F0JC26_9BACT|nr:MoaD/ThiS family protein [Pseudodesulfovibrio mercurii]EGB15599.1 thiamine S protein [Pseudodesulfovibrio mercurii]